MSLESQKLFRCRENPDPGEFAVVNPHSLSHIKQQLEIHHAAWKRRIQNAESQSLEHGIHAMLGYNAIAEKCEQGAALITAYRAEQLGIELSSEYRALIPNAPHYALGAYATSLFMRKLLGNKTVGVSILTKDQANIGLDLPGLGKVDQPWMVHVDRQVLDTMFEASDAPVQWYSDKNGALLVTRNTEATPTDRLRFDTQMDGIPIAFDQMATCSPHLSVAALPQEYR